uniref:TTF-type domain-containing protein n=1 Tax=Amphimedon queenslandica TaxID=400682 RepID=A0A1X7VXC8_AMPQE
MASSSLRSTVLNEVPSDKPHQPRLFLFPHQEFGKTHVTKRSFQPQWFHKCKWLHYVEEKDLAFCNTCVVAQQKNQLHSVSNLEQNFISIGFSNWKDATAKLTKHESSHWPQRGCDAWKRIKSLERRGSSSGPSITLLEKIVIARGRKVDKQTALCKDHHNHWILKKNSELHT